MRRLTSTVLFLAAVAFSWSSCFLVPGGGGGGGGGGSAGGGTGFSFSSGFASVRKDDRNLYLTDERDVNSPAQLTTTGGVSMPSFSRDGRQLVFARKTGQDSELALVPVSGGTPTTLLRSTATQQNLRTPVFSPDGTRVAFAYDENATSSSVGVVNVDGSGFRKVIGGGALAYASPSWFADGLSLLVSAGNAGLSQTQVEKVDVATGAPTNITNALGEALSIASRVVVSPDGKLAVFDGRVASGVTRVFVLDLTSKTVTRQRTPSSGAVNDSAPTWVDSTTFLFSSDEGGADQAYRQVVGSMNVVLALPLAIEPASYTARAPVDGGSPDAGP